MGIFTGVAAAALMLAATGANALTYNWSFTADAEGSTSLGPVTGTISGLQIGSNDGTGLIVNVLSSPSGNLLVGDWEFISGFILFGSPAFSIDSEKNVILANAIFSRNGDDGQNINLSFFPGGYATQLFGISAPDGGFYYTYHTTYNAPSFSLVSDVPLPAALPLLLAGLGGLGLIARRDRPA